MTSAEDATAGDHRQYLDSLVLHGIKLGLQNITAMMEACGRPQCAYPVIHVAGTNGKGSVLTFLGAILGAAGYRVGRFTSPHLLDVTERFLLGSTPMNEEDLRENILFFRDIAERGGFAPTYFEMNTAVALRWFAQRAVDVALVEVGMGGRYDSTNVVEPLACAITNIDLDHTQYLGDTLEKIAFEKAGIIKPGVPVVLGDVRPGPLEVIRQVAEERGSRVYHLGEDYSFVPAGTVWQPQMTYHGFGLDLTEVSLGLVGKHQHANAAVVMSLAALLREHFPRITEAAIREGMRAARWPVRLEKVLDDPPVIMDAAHNPAGCQAIADTFQTCVVVFSVSSDKDAGDMIRILGRIADPLILTTYRGERSLGLDALRQCAQGIPHVSFPGMEAALEAGIRLASPAKPLLVAGSIYGAGQARRYLMETHGAHGVAF